MRGTALVAGVILVAAGPLGGCLGEECAATATQGLTVDLVAPGGYADGGYEVVAIADGVTLRGGFAVGGGQATCAAGCALVAEAAVVVFAGRLELRGVETVMLNVVRVRGDEARGGPTQLQVTVLREGVELGLGWFEPDYHEACGPWAREMVELAPVSAVCPAVPPSDGERCEVEAGRRCEGAELVTSCDGRTDGVRTCACEDGVWSCPNLACAPWCPATLAEAREGGACEVGAGPCFYADGGHDILCGCADGTIACFDLDAP